MVSGIILIIIGIGFYSKTSAIYPAAFGILFGPLFLIVLGLNLIFRQKRIGFFREENIRLEKKINFRPWRTSLRAGKKKKNMNKYYLHCIIKGKVPKHQFNLEGMEGALLMWLIKEIFLVW